MIPSDLGLVSLCLDTGHEESLKAVTMPMVNNDVCSRLKDGAGDSRVCAGGKRGEGVCDVSQHVGGRDPFLTI